MNRAPNGTIIVEMLGSYGPYVVGTRAAYPEEIALRLVRDGMAKHTRPKNAPPVKEPAKEPAKQVVEETPEPVEEDDDPLAEIRDNPSWKTLHGNKLRVIASEVSPMPITSKEDAIAAIELALEG